MTDEEQIVSTGDWGFDVVLGGGVRVFSRAEGLRPSATMVFRGPPGAGKSILAAQTACALAQARNDFVLYACVELLPTELRAQLKGFEASQRFGSVSLVPQDAKDAPPFEARAIFATLLPLATGGPDETSASLAAALRSVLKAVRERLGTPGVLVIDSVSDGYGLGASFPRERVDGVMKLAAELGAVIIVVEESDDERPSAWCYAADTVVQLGLASDPEASPERRSRRQIEVTKHRFAASSPGAHELSLEAGWGALVLPSPVAYGNVTRAPGAFRLLQPH